jgi:hypothetical protein
MDETMEREMRGYVRKAKNHDFSSYGSYPVPDRI